MSTTSSMITPEPTGTCAVLAMTFGGAGAAGVAVVVVVTAGVSTVDVAADPLLVADYLNFVEQAATIALITPAPAPMNIVRRPRRRCSSRMGLLLSGTRR